MKGQLKSCGIIAGGTVIFALSYNWFFSPNLISTGGITGLAQVIHALLPWAPVGALSFLLNVPLFLLGWRLIGFHLLASSLFAMAVSSLAIDVMTLVHVFAPMDPMLAALCGGASMGLGLGIIFSQGATLGGTGIVARLMRLKLPWLPVGRLMMIPDLVVLILAAITFHQVETALYGGVGLFISARVMDTVLYGLHPSRVACIITEHWRDTADALMSELHRGVTFLRGEGAYTGTEKQVLLVAFPQKQVAEVKRVVHRIDPAAFLIVCDAHDVLGNGFGEYQKTC